IVGRDDRQAALGHDLLAQIDIGALEADDQGHDELHLAGRGHHALGDDVAAHVAAEDVDQDAPHVGILEDDLEGRGDALLGGAAADIEEVGRLGAVQLDDVHGRHGEAGAVDHAADLAVQLDVVQRPLGGFQLGGVLLVRIAHVLDILVPEQRVVVEVHLGVERDHVAGAGNDQRVDLDDRGVKAGEGLVHRQHELGRRLDLLALQAEAEGDPAGVMRLHAGGRVDGNLEDLLGVLGGNLLDLHAALGGGHHGDARGGAVDQEAQVELALDVAAFLDIEALDQLALGAGLVGHQGHAQHLAGLVLHVVQRLDDLDAAALAAAAGMNLGLYNPDGAAELAGDGHGLVGRKGDSAAGNGNAVFREQAFRLIFMDIHADLTGFGPGAKAPVMRIAVRGRGYSSLPKCRNLCSPSPGGFFDESSRTCTGVTLDARGRVRPRPEARLRPSAGASAPASGPARRRGRTAGAAAQG